MIADRLAALSAWIDDSNAGRDPEAILWGRVSKVAEEAGEAIAATVGLTGQNPRKGTTHDVDDLIDELLDVAVAALGAVEHLTGNQAASLGLLGIKTRTLIARARISDGVVS